uniref:Uncharacterized protein n=1 Tax=Utricularia reniformis TaxID=192314 RepID=A0A1Y0B0J0_9LAMI|nr:hypothetical protein AEK19_MT0658 [Utricularia reniformis]ART30909.1 hypothetical protein AEK19_MT0658 [Utricularia reniformis]
MLLLFRIRSIKKMDYFTGQRRSLRWDDQVERLSSHLGEEFRYATTWNCEYCFCKTNGKISPRAQSWLGRRGRLDESILLVFNYLCLVPF